ncbi:hypothetical protein OROMI_009573 [Orobanche minor]
MEGRVSEEPQKVQTGITSCVCHGQIGEISKLYQKTLFIEEKHLSRVQSDLDDSGDKTGGHSEGPLFNLHFDMSGIARGENDPEVHICEVYPELLILDNELHPAIRGSTIISVDLNYAKIALKFYEERQDAEFGILQVLLSNRAKLAVPGYEGVGLWCHVSFIAKPRNAGYIDDSPKHFFGELLFDRAKGKYDVTYCSIFDPRDPRNVGGCVFCPQDEVFLHPADGCPANGRGSGKTLAQKGTEASQGQAGGCSKLHSEKPYIFRNADDQDIITEAERDLDLKYAKIALEFYKKNKDAVFEIVEPLFSRCKPVPGSKCNEEWWCHVTFTAKPKSADCSDVALEHFFGELSRDSTTREYNATYCEIFKPTVRRSSPGSNAPPRSMGVVSNVQGSIQRGRGHTGKLVHAATKGSKVRFGTWNVGSLTGRAAEIGEVMKRMRIHIMCLQEIKWVGEKARVLAPWGYKLWYSGKARSRNGVGIVIDKEMIDDVVEVSRKSDRIMSIKLVIGDEFLTIISAYAPQVGLDVSIKQEFWEDLEEVVERIPMSEKLIIGGDLNGHVGVSRDGFESVHGGFGFGDRNEAENDILDFALAYDLGIMNTWFEKRDSHLVTYRNGAIKTKRECYKVLGKCSSDENYERYKKARTEAKKAVRNARSKVNKELYARLDTKEGEKDIYKLVRMRDRKTRDIGKVKCVKDTDQKVLVQDKEIKERWRSYFDTLFNGHQEQDIGNLNIPSSMVNREFKRRIQKGEVTMALKKMGSKKAEGPDGIPIEVWRCLGERGIDWLTMLFNKIWRSNKMPSAWRKSILVPLYKNKGDVHNVLKGVRRV